MVKGEENWPHSQYLTDVLRASYIVSSAEDMVRMWESLLASSEFDETDDGTFSYDLEKCLIGGI